MFQVINYPIFYINTKQLNTTRIQKCSSKYGVPGQKWQKKQFIFKGKSKTKKRKNTNINKQLEIAFCRRNIYFFIDLVNFHSTKNIRTDSPVKQIVIEFANIIKDVVIVSQFIQLNYDKWTINNNSRFLNLTH